MTTKKLTRRQARWAEFLLAYNFQITYRPGKDNRKADALTRRSGDLPNDQEDPRTKEQHRTLLTKDRLHPDICLQVMVTHINKEPESEVTPTIIERIAQAQEKDEFCQTTIQLLRGQARRSPDIQLLLCNIDKRGLL
jgi:hypothetical protein